MINKIINSPYVLGITLSAINLATSLLVAEKGSTGSYFLSLTMMLVPLSLIAAYSYFTKLTFSKSFKYSAILAQFIFGLGIEEVATGRVFSWYKTMGIPMHPVLVIMIFALTILGACGINYLYLTLGNKLGLWIAKKTK